jgi:hypothetical protein
MVGRVNLFQELILLTRTVDLWVEAHVNIPGFVLPFRREFNK